MSRTYGMARIAEGKWHITAEPHVSLMFKRVFTSLGRQFGTLKISHTATNAELLDWLMLRFPLELSERDRAFLDQTNARTRARRETCRAILTNAHPVKVDTLLPLRDYQMQAVHFLKHAESLLLVDDIGLGKTVVGLGSLALDMQPALVVCKTHLPHQWQDEAKKFLGGVKPHIIEKAKPYPLPEHNLAIISYSKIAKWADVLKEYKLVIFDEVQELRCAESNKYAAAEHLCETIPYRLGLTATPIYNYGDEIFNIVNVLAPGILGTRFEFLTEWCNKRGMHYIVSDPTALGTFLLESGVYMRRRRKEVGRELPPVIKIAEEVEYDGDALLHHDDQALQLAKAVLNGTWNERGQAALQLDALMRMQTGIAKAPFVAEFVRQLVESGEAVLLTGWHREVYSIWESCFQRAGIHSRLYTGSETPKQKLESAKDFIEGRADVMMISLRSGEGLNGLQERASIVVHGELDWSPQVHEQVTGRLNRDGQPKQVTAIFLYAAGGSDPVIAQTLGIKRSQSEGIINPGESALAVTDQQATTARAALLARQILARVKPKKETYYASS